MFAPTSAKGSCTTAVSSLSWFAAFGNVALYETCSILAQQYLSHSFSFFSLSSRLFPSFFLPSPNLSHSPPCSGPTPPPPSTIVPAPTNAVQEGMGDRRRKGWEECGHHHKAAGMEDRRRTTINKCTVATVVTARRPQ